MFPPHPTAHSHSLIIRCAIITLLCGSAALAQTTYTWIAYDNTTASGTINADWATAGNWDPNGVYSSGALNELMFFDDTNGVTYATGSNQLEQEGTLNINNVASVSMRTLTLDGRGPNNSASTLINIGDGSATWTIGDGSTGTVNMTSSAGGGGDRYVKYIVNPNVTLNGNVTFTGGSGALDGYRFTGDINDGGSGYGITKSGNSQMILSGNSTYSGATTISGGLLIFSGANSLSASSGLSLNGGTAVMGGSLTRDLGSGSGQLQITGGNSGFSTASSNLDITAFNDASQELVWGTASFNPNQLTLNNTTAGANIYLRNQIDLGGGTRTINVGANTAFLNGDIQTSSGTAGITKTGTGVLHLSGTSTYNGNTTLTQGTVSIETSANAGSGGSIIFNGGSLGIRGNTLAQLSNIGHSVTLSSNKTVGFDISDRGHQFTADIALTQGSGGLVKAGRGSLVLDQANTFSGATTATGGGSLVLDYSGQDNSKLSDSNSLTLGGTTLKLSGGTHGEVVSITSIAGGTANAIVRDSGSATIALNAISIAPGKASLSLSADGIATTDRTNNVNTGLLGSWATVGSHWALNQTNGPDGSIIAYAGYTALPGSGGTASTNYQVLGNTSYGGGSVGTLRIANTGNDGVMTLTGSMSVASATLGSYGGILFAGGSNNNYTITGVNIGPSNGNGQALLINTYTGKLTVNSTLNYGSSGLTKTGEGILELANSSTYSGETLVTQGGLVMNVTSSGNSPITVSAGARIGGTGTIGGSLTLQEGADFIFNATSPLIASGLVSLDDSFGILNLVNEDGSVLNWSLIEDGTYTLIDNGSEFSNIQNLGLVNAADIGGGRSAYFQQGSLQLVVVPEPSSLLLMSMSSLILLSWRRRS